MKRYKFKEGMRILIQDFGYSSGRAYRRMKTMSEYEKRGIKFTLTGLEQREKKKQGEKSELF